jgi:hypothetical protein
MIITNIIGGLGNQMFQYAMGRTLAYQHKTDLLVDTRMFQGYGLRNFELETVFNIQTHIATEGRIKKLIGWKANKLSGRLLREPCFAFLRGRNYYIEPAVNYVKEVRNLHDDCYISGYWQSERYFEDIKELIRTDWTFRQPLEGLNAELADKIKSMNAVSLHVRRADYVMDQRTNSVHGACPKEYFDRAVKYISELISSPAFFIFSDDPEWVKANLSLNYEHYFISHNTGLDSFNDMHLMSLCRHHIIANSSFSWWGAWLNTDNEITCPDPG